jgi:hypothetical protein
MIVVTLTLISAAAPCGDAPTRQEIQEAIVNSKHMIIPMADCLCLYSREQRITFQSNH